MAKGSVKRDPEREGTWRFVVDVPGKDGVRRQIKRRGFPTRKAAQAALDELKREVGTGRGVEPNRLTFGAFLEDRWLPYIAASTKLKPTTRGHYRRMAQHLITGCGSVQLSALRGDDLDRVYASLNDKSASLRRGVHVTAHKALGDAIRWRLVAFNAANDADAPKIPKPRPRAWTAEQVRTFLEVAGEDRWAALWRITATTGMRRGEVVGLRWSDIDLDAGKVLVVNNVTTDDHRTVEGTTKTDKDRPLGLDARTVAMLREWRKQQNEERLAIGKYWPDTGRVWTWPDGSPLHPLIVSKTFGRLAARAGLPPLTFHSLRHSWATNALAARVNIKTVSTRLGHSSISVTLDIYVEPSGDDDQGAADTVANLYDAI